MMRRQALSIFLALLAGTGIPSAQTTGDLHRIADATSGSIARFEPLRVPKNGGTVIADITGPGKVTYFYITDDTVGKWKPGLVLKVYWDDATEPSIEVPLADFFGSIGGKNVDFQSAAMQLNDNCFMCYLPMPFATRARFVLANDGETDYQQKVAYGVDYESGAAHAGERSRLHAEWRRSNPVTKGLHTILETTGRGQYAGGFLQVVSKDRGVWFGEGDTIFHLDGRDVTHSPGSEDEYGSCWATAAWKTYSSLYCGHPLNEDGVNRMYRWYIVNPIRFKSSLKVEIQNQHDNVNPTTTDADDYTSVAFWYQEGTRRVVPLPPLKVRTAPAFSTP